MLLSIHPVKGVALKRNAEDYWESDEKVTAAGPLGARAATPLEVEVPAALLAREVPPAQGEPPSNKFLFYLNLHFLAICRVPTVFFTFAPLLSISPSTYSSPRP
jgi:hypothetical protein